MNVTLPWPPNDLSPNARVHFMARARVAKEYRRSCAWLAKKSALTRVECESLQVIITFHPPSKRRRDLDNCVAAFKAGADGLADILGVDDSKWLPEYRMDEPVKGGLVVVEFPTIE